MADKEAVVPKKDTKKQADKDWNTQITSYIEFVDAACQKLRLIPSKAKWLFILSVISALVIGFFSYQMTSLIGTTLSYSKLIQLEESTNFLATISCNNIGFYG